MIDVLTRVDAICKKYDRYDADKHRKDGDPFSRLYAAVDAEIDATIEVCPWCLSCYRYRPPPKSCPPMHVLVQKSAKAAKEKNRAASVTLNADVRRTKAQLLEEVVKLQKIAAKKVKPPSLICTVVSNARNCQFVCIEK